MNTRSKGNTASNPTAIACSFEMRHEKQEAARKKQPPPLSDSVGVLTR